MAAGAIVVLAGCVRPPSVAGVAGTSAAPNAVWAAPRAAPREAAPAPALPAGLAEHVNTLTLADIVDLALRNNPATRASWEAARSAAAAYGAQRGAYYPTLDAEIGAARQKTAGRFAVDQTSYAPSVSLSFLLFDFGGRSGAVEAAKQALVAADWTHNATLQDVVLQVERAYFEYMAAKALLAAQQATLAEARTSLAAAEERRRVGLGTIADVLQARTALSQAQLDVETTEGTLQTTRGALAVAMGLPANVPYDVTAPAQPIPVAGVADSVDALIAQAVRTRPDLAAAEAQFAQARSRIREVRAERLPALMLGGTGGRTYVDPAPAGRSNGANTYSVTLGLRIPLFAGFSRAYDQMQAEADAAAAAAHLDALRQQVVFQVFSSYYALQTATRRVRTADDLLASAQQSQDVALGRYRAGVGSVLDLLAAQSALASARAQQVQARWIWQTALAQLAHDIGTLDVHGGNPIRLAPDSTGNNPPR